MHVLLRKPVSIFKRTALPTCRSASASISVLAIMVLLCCICVSCARNLLFEPSSFYGSPKSISTPAPETPTDPNKPYPLQTEPPFIVALDAGHGGGDTGAQGLKMEVEVCEATTDALYALLEADVNYAPIRTRPNGQDLSTTDRAAVATAHRASLLISIHANCDHSTGQSHGFECFPTPPGRTYTAESMRFAECITLQMSAAGHRLRGENGIRFLYYVDGGHRKKIVESSDTRVRDEKSFGMVEKPHCPAILVEQCFLTNESDVRTWASEEGCTRSAHIYYQAICLYFGTVPLEDAHR